jgi:hypothetical protein
MMIDMLYGEAQTIRIEVPGLEGFGFGLCVQSGGDRYWYQSKEDSRMRECPNTFEGIPWTSSRRQNEAISDVCERTPANIRFHLSAVWFSRQRWIPMADIWLPTEFPDA